MENKQIITIVTPKTATTKIETDLVQLTQTLVKKGLGEGTGTNGALGGEYGYGVDFENDVFMMHHFCWCGSKDCPWCLSCYCTVKKIKGEYVTTKQCDNHTKESLPNFWYKPTDLKIHWCKWIGRDMEYNKKPNKNKWKTVFTHCLASIGA